MGSDLGPVYMLGSFLQVGVLVTFTIKFGNWIHKGFTSQINPYLMINHQPSIDYLVYAIAHKTGN